MTTSNRKVTKSGEAVRRPIRTTIDCFKPSRRDQLLLKEASERLEACQLPENLTGEYIESFLKGLDCQEADTVLTLYKNRERWDELVDYKINPLDYTDPLQFRKAYIASKFLSKSSFFALDGDKRKRAIDKFLAMERHCAENNKLLSNLNSHPDFKGVNVDLLNRQIRIITKVLGDFTPFEFVSKCSWGPRSTRSIKGKDAVYYKKFARDCGATLDISAFIEPWFSTAFPHWIPMLKKQPRFREVEWSELRPFLDIFKGSKICCVEKTSKIDRVICIEPGLNMFFQKGAGGMIRKRLMSSFNIDLSKKASPKNQRLALQGSIDGSYATVDFSSASDTICTKIVELLIPPRWFTLLNALRSKVFELPASEGDLNEAHYCQKFSSMGNGFTFELETLIFHTAAMAVAERNNIPSLQVSTFGDDVVLPSHLFDEYISYCKLLGFIVNPDKSFSTGFFRESCGEHYMCGIDCKPLYLKKEIHDVPTAYKTANQTRALAHRFCGGNGCDSRFRAAWGTVLRGIHPSLRIGISAGYGDCGLVVNLDEAMRNTASLSCLVGIRKAFLGFEGWVTPFLKEVPKMLENHSSSYHIAKLWGLSIKTDSPSELDGYTGYWDVFRSAEFRLSARLTPFDIDITIKSKIADPCVIKNGYTNPDETKSVYSYGLLIPRWYDLGPWQ